MSTVKELEEQKKRIEQQIKDQKHKDYMDSLPNVLCPYCNSKMIPQTNSFSDDNYASFSKCPNCQSETPHYYGTYLYNKHPTGLVERSVKEMKFFSDWKCK